MENYIKLESIANKMIVETYNPKEYNFRGIKISNINYDGVLKYINGKISKRQRAYFCMTDVGNLMMAQNDKELAKAINQADISFADGTPIAWFGKMIKMRDVERISGVNLFQKLVHTTDYVHFLLGDTEKLQKDVIEKAKKNKKNVKIKGFSPPFKERFSIKDNEEIIKKINDAQPDIIWVSFGGGKQEKWINQNINKIEKGIMVGVGAAFKFYTGVIPIPPEMIQRLGLQWTARLRKNPKRWMTKGQLKFRLKFTLLFPLELCRAKKYYNK